MWYWPFGRPLRTSRLVLSIRRQSSRGIAAIVSGARVSVRRRMDRNLLIQGDCLDAMLALDRHDVRLAYLDPPFNTGERSRDYADAMDRRAWADFMAPRLAATWDLLRADGSVWVHCDDSEQATLRVLMDELFGRRAFVATI